MTNSQAADSVKNSLRTADAHKVTVEVGFEECFFGHKVTQAKPLLLTIKAQHHCQLKRRTSRHGCQCMRRDQRQHLKTLHNSLHLIEQDLLACAPCVEIEDEVFLFHGVINSKLHASITTIQVTFIHAFLQYYFFHIKYFGRGFMTKKNHNKTEQLFSYGFLKHFLENFKKLLWSMPRLLQN